MTEPKEPKKQKQRNPVNTYARFSGIAFQMIVIIGLGTFGGVKLDEAYPNTYSLGTIICSMLSVGIAMWYVIRQVKKNSNT